MKPGEDFAIRTPVWKRPTEYRDAISLPPHLLYKTWYLNRVLSYSWQPKIGIGDYVDEEELRQFVMDSSKDTCFLMTDYKKSGLTMPHWFLSVVVEVLRELNPNEDIDFPCNGWPIFDPKNGKIFQGKGYGYGLGMVNNAYTLFNIVIFNLAKEDNILDEKAKILSFNDDSIIKSTIGEYVVYLDYAAKFGGYIEKHKSWASNLGGNFCEIHQFKNNECSFKWVSYYHTLWSAVYKAINMDHWRFMVTDMFDANRGYEHDVSKSAQTWANEILLLIKAQIIELGTARWKPTVNFTIGNPELGRSRVGLDHVTRRWGLKQTLVVLENWPTDKQVRTFNYVIKVKESQNYKIRYAPWKVFPEGKTKELFIKIGSLKGFNNELSSMLDKAENKFMLDTEYFQQDYWTNFKKNLDDSQLNPKFRLDFWDWAVEQNWNSYCLPENFVSNHSLSTSHSDFLCMARLPSQETKYSLIAMLTEYISHIRNVNYFPDIPFTEIDFSPYFQWIMPVETNSDSYRPIGNMTYLGQIAEFGDTQRVIREYHQRTGKVPMELKLPDNKSNAILDLLKKLNDGDNSFDHCTKATWYTKYPMPYDDVCSKILDQTLPDYHMEIIIAYENKIFNDEIFKIKNDINFDAIKRDKENNKSWWSERTKKKQKNVKKQKKDILKNPTILPTRFDEEIESTTINMDDWGEIFKRAADEALASLKLLLGDDEEPPSNTSELNTNVLEAFNLGDIPDWARGQPSEVSCSEDESNLLPDSDEEHVDEDEYYADMIQLALAHQSHQWWDEAEDSGIG